MKQIDINKIGKLIEDRIKKEGVRSLARGLKMSTGSLYLYRDRVNKEIKSATLQKIAHYFNIDVDELYCDIPALPALEANGYAITSKYPKDLEALLDKVVVVMQSRDIGTKLALSQNIDMFCEKVKEREISDYEKQALLDRIRYLESKFGQPSGEVDYHVKDDLPDKAVSK